MGTVAELQVHAKRPQIEYPAMEGGKGRSWGHRLANYPLNPPPPTLCEGLISLTIKDQGFTY